MSRLPWPVRHVLRFTAKGNLTGYGLHCLTGWAAMRTGTVAFRHVVFSQIGLSTAQL